MQHTAMPNLGIAVLLSAFLEIMKYKIFLLIFLLNALRIQAQQNTFSERAYRIGSTGRVIMSSTLTKQGNVLFSGTFVKASVWEQPIFYAIKPNLDTLWSRKGPKTSMLEQGISATSDGGYIFGSTTEVTSNNYDSDDMLLYKMNANGQPVWTRTYSGVPNIGDDGTLAVLTMPDKGYVMGGFGSIISKQKWYSLVYTDSLGNVKWRRSYDWASDDGFAAMCYTKNGNILTAGSILGPNLKFHIKLLIVKSNGDSLSSNFLNINGISRSEEMTPGSSSLLSLSDGGFLINARVDSVISGSPYCRLGMLIKVDSNLQVVWKHVYRPYFTPWRDFAKAVELADGSIIVVGTDLPSAIQPASNNIYLHHISAQGVPINVHTFPSTYSYVFINTMQVLPDSSFIVGGNCYTNTNNRGLYAAKIKIPGLPKVISGLPAERKVAKAELGQSYPNPATSSAIIPYSLPIGTKQSRIIIRDITGREVGNYTLNINSNSLKLNFNNQSTGLYTYTLLVEERPIATKKLSVIK